MSILIVEGLIMQVEQIHQMLACLEKLAWTTWYHWTIKVSDVVMLLLADKLNMHFTSGQLVVTKLTL